MTKFQENVSADGLIDRQKGWQILCHRTLPNTDWGSTKVKNYLMKHLRNLIEN